MTCPQSLYHLQSQTWHIWNCPLFVPVVMLVVWVIPPIARPPGVTGPHRRLVGLQSIPLRIQAEAGVIELVGAGHTVGGGCSTDP